MQFHESFSFDRSDNSTGCSITGGLLVIRWRDIQRRGKREEGRRSRLPVCLLKTRDNGQLCGSKTDRCSLTCMLVHRRSRKTGRYHRSCKSLRLSGTAAPASATPPSLQQNPRKKHVYLFKKQTEGKYRFARTCAVDNFYFSLTSCTDFCKSLPMTIVKIWRGKFDNFREKENTSELYFECNNVACRSEKVWKMGREK